MFNLQVKCGYALVHANEYNKQKQKYRHLIQLSQYKNLLCFILSLLHVVFWNHLYSSNNSRVYLKTLFEYLDHAELAYKG